jgi:hypothetical protein
MPIGKAPGFPERLIKEQKAGKGPGGFPRRKKRRYIKKEINQGEKYLAGKIRC